MKRRLKALWLNFLDRPDEWFIAGFILTFPLTIRKVIFSFPAAGAFNEYMAGFIYLSDIFLVLIVATGGVKTLLEYKKDKLSSSSEKEIDDSGTGDKSRITRVIHNLYWLMPTIFVGWSIISISWAQNGGVGLYRALKQFELFCLYGYVVFRIVPRGTMASYKRLSAIIILSAIIQSFIAIWQFISQHSIGLKILGESLIDANSPGVAKILLDGEKYIRSYGLMPHPNILGGYLVLSIILTYLYGKLFHNNNSRLEAVEQFSNRSFKLPVTAKQKCSTWNIFKDILRLTPVHIRGKMLNFIVKRLKKAKLLIMSSFGELGYFRRVDSRLSRQFVAMDHIGVDSSMAAECFSCSTQGQLWNNGERLNSFTQISSKNTQFNKSWPNNGAGGIFYNYIAMKCSTWNILSRLRWFGAGGQTSQDLPHICRQMWLFKKKWLIKALIVIQISALFFTFSKSAFLSLLLAAGYIAMKCSTWNNFSAISCSTSPVPQNENVPRGTFWITMAEWGKKMFHVEHFRIYVLTALIILLSFVFFAHPDINSLFFKSINERLIYLDVSRGTILANMLTGVGVGQFVPTISKYANNLILAWQHQPVHNVYLLIWAENGLVGLGLFLGWIWVILLSRQSHGVFKNIRKSAGVLFLKRLVRASQKYNCSTWNNYINWHGIMNKALNVLSTKLFCVKAYGFIYNSDKVILQDKIFTDRRRETNCFSQADYRPSQAASHDTGEWESWRGHALQEHKNIKMSRQLLLVYMKGIFLAFLFIMLFDHYFWDIWQGQVMFWMVAGLIVGIIRANKKRYLVSSAGKIE